MLGFVLQEESDLGQRIAESAVAQFPVVGDEISGTVSQSRLRGSGLALGVGLGLALWGGLGVAEAAQAAMNGIWNVPRRRYPNFFLRRLRGLAWLVILGGGLLLASVVSGFAAAADTSWSGPAGVAASTLVNMLLFLVGFRVLTVRNVSLRTLLPGAVLAALAWALLQWLGGWYVDRQLSRASATYGAFALVIGLLSWLYLASTVTLLAAELNVVRNRRLWPRSLAPPPWAGPTSAPLRAWPSRRSGCPTSGSRSASTATPSRPRSGPASGGRRLRPGSRGPGRGRPRPRPRRSRPARAGPAAATRPPGGWSPGGRAG